MGQVHPSGVNVVRLTQRGGGHNCDCGHPYFDEHEIATDARLTQLVPPQEIVQMVQTANSVMKKVYKNILPIMIAMMIIGSMIPQLLFVYIDPDDKDFVWPTNLFVKVCWWAVLIFHPKFMNCLFRKRKEKTCDRKYFRPVAHP